jgi:hypothetical protein
LNHYRVGGLSEVVPVGRVQPAPEQSFPVRGRTALRAYKIRSSRFRLIHRFGPGRRLFVMARPSGGISWPEVWLQFSAEGDIALGPPAARLG